MVIVEICLTRGLIEPRELPALLRAAERTGSPGP
jgi:hypothetical protein